MLIPKNAILSVNLPVNKQFQNNRDIVLLLNEVIPSVVIPNICTRVIDNSINLDIININNDEFTLNAGTRLCDARYLELINSENKLRVSNFRVRECCSTVRGENY